MPMPPVFSFEARKTFLRNLAEGLNRNDLEARLIEMADDVGHDRFREQAAADIVASARPADALPQVYAEYRRMVADGIRFLLSRLAIPRIAALIADQARASLDTPSGARLLMLARKLPTLHKLGQMIARNRHMDPTFKRWLVALENGPCSVSMSDISTFVQAELGEDMARFGIEIGPAAIAEASVGLAVPFTFAPEEGADRRHGVFKMLKPGVREHLHEELDILAELADYLERRRHLYPLKDFRFADTFADIRAALIGESDLAGEQEKIKAAFRFYHDKGPARVPAVHDFSTPDMTAMGFMAGEKITDACTMPVVRRRLAQDLFRILIWRPLFSMEPMPPFHGDPHAGNLLAHCPDAASDDRIGLIDWSLSGTLPRAKRSRLVFMMLGILMAHRDMIIDGIQALSADDDRCEGVFRDRAAAAIQSIMAGADFQGAGIAKKAFVLLDGLALAGFRFPKDLLLFRKTFFTLEGVLFDLHPSFDVDGAMVAEMTRLFLSEAPQRWASWMFPLMDRPENYRSLISNLDLRILAQHFVTAFFRRGATMTAAFLGTGLGMIFPYRLWEGYRLKAEG